MAVSGHMWRGLDEVMDERGNAQKECWLYEAAVSVCNSTPDFMSFVSLDCKYAGSQISHSSTKILFIFSVCIYISISVVILFFWDTFDLMRCSAIEWLVCLLTCGNLIFQNCLIKYFVSELSLSVLLGCCWVKDWERKKQRKHISKLLLVPLVLDSYFASFGSSVFVFEPLKLFTFGSFYSDCVGQLACCLVLLFLHVCNKRIDMLHQLKCRASLIHSEEIRSWFHDQHFRSLYILLDDDVR